MFSNRHIQSLFHFLTKSMLSSETKETVQKIPLLSMKAGPRDGENFKIRLKEELNALIQVL